MVVRFPFKRIFGLVGAPRTGKNEVARFLEETRGFEQIAFADQIKEEFGISKEDFEAAKIAGNIKELRDKLWAFSAEKKKDDPLYFVRKVIQKALNSENSVVITDIRTPEELASFLHMESDVMRRIYWTRVEDEEFEEFDENNCLTDSKLPQSVLANCGSPSSEYDFEWILNEMKGLYSFYRSLDNLFFLNDLQDIWGHKTLRGNSILYVNQFEVRQKGN